MKAALAITLLILSNVFMTLAWYGHLFYFKKISWIEAIGIFGIILLSWGLAFFEYMCQVPANRIGFKDNGGPFTLFELKVIQEALSLIVFAVFAVVIFKTDKLSWNYVVGFLLILLGVFFVFKKW